MFGDEPILGVDNRKIDVKGRLFMPSWTYAETGDELVFKNNNDNFIELCTFDSLKKYFQLLNEKYYSESNPEVKENIKMELEQIYATIYGISTVDKNGRILIPKNLRIEQKIESEIVIQGAYDHLHLFKNKEAYQNYITKINR